MQNLTNELAYWINERDAIRVRRAQGLPAPWSEDPIFNHVRFCNVHREHDKVTIYFRRVWNRGDDPAWQFVLGRMINLPSSLAIVGPNRATLQTLEESKSLLKRARDTGAKIFTSAYTISTCGKKMGKLDYVFDHVVQAVKAAGEPDFHSMERTAATLGKIDGLGTFLVGQVLADMKNTANHPLQGAPDWWTWSAPGPGSLRGLSYYFGQGVTATRYGVAVRECYSEVMPLVHTSIGKLHMQDFQNCLCEFSKYRKVTLDPSAHVRNHYDPRHQG